MKNPCALLLLVALLAAAAPAEAQLLRPNDRGMSMGHVLLNVTDIPAHMSFWIREFGARPIVVGRLEGVTIPGLVVLFRQQDPSGPGEGTVINHLGLKVTRLADYTARFDAAGWEYDPPRVGREGTVQLYVTGPEGFRVEVVEDPRLPVPVISHHLHYWLPEPTPVKEWYVRTLQLDPTMRGPYESGDLPGMNLTFAPLGNQPAAGEPTSGRLMDSIGFEVRNLDAYVERLKTLGIRFDVILGLDWELGMPSVTLTDPWGTTIRLTEGLAEKAGTASFDYVDGYVVPAPLP